MADVLVEKSGAVTTLVLNRPESRNALSNEMRTILRDELNRAEHDAAVRCVVIRGQGGHFMAGGDVKGFAEIDEETRRDRAYWLERIHEIHTVLYALRRMPKPVIASVAGAAAGAGVSLAAACDLVMAADNAFFTLAYVHIGTSPDWGSTFHLPRAVGVKRAMQMAMLGERIDAATAAAWGLVNFVVPAADLTAETEKLSTRLANGPTRALANAKRLIHESLHNDLETQAQREAEAFSDSVSGSDFAEGVRAFVEKRKPRFAGS